jgi:amino acid transporter
MARDGLLPRWIGVRSRRTGAPRRAILLAAVLYAACLGLGFRRLVEIDVILYGAALTLQFGALIVLRLREPQLARPFLIPGGIVGLLLLSSLPLGLLALALWVGRNEPGMWGLSGLQLGALIALCGPLLYGLRKLWQTIRRRRQPTAGDPGESAEPIVLSL